MIFLYIGSVGLLVGHPMDSLKVLLQTQTNSNNSSIPHPSSSNNTAAPNANANAASSINTTTRSLHTAADLLSNSNNASANNHHQHNKNNHSFKRQIMLNRSLQSLYSGISVPLITVGLVQSTNFMLYDSIRRGLYAFSLSKNDLSSNHNNYLYHDEILKGVVVASGAAGAIISLFTSPMQVIKTKQQIMLWDLKMAARETWRRVGFIYFILG